MAKLRRVCRDAEVAQVSWLALTESLAKSRTDAEKEKHEQELAEDIYTEVNLKNKKYI